MPVRAELLFSRCHAFLRECRDTGVALTLMEALNKHLPVELVDKVIEFAVEGRVTVSEGRIAVEELGTNSARARITDELLDSCKAECESEFLWDKHGKQYTERRAGIETAVKCWRLLGDD